MILRIISVYLLVFVLSACSSIKSTAKMTPVEDWRGEIEHLIKLDSTFRQSHTGLLIREIGSSEDIISIKSDQYFTPASNTKLLTFYTSLKIIPKRITGLKIYENQDSVMIWGTGDASFLNPFLKVNDFISERLKSSEKSIYFSTSNFQDEHYGSGWSWDDYNYGYQTDKHSLPIYGNLIHFYKPLVDSDLQVKPSYFRILTIPNQEEQRATFMRKEKENLIFFDHDKLKHRYQIDRYVPYLTSDELQVQLLSDHLGRQVELIQRQSNIGEAEKIPSVDVDSLYQLLLQPSDNFVAEQLLLNCGSELFDTLNTAKVISWARKNLFHDMPHPYQWVDGSGLSRYNMTTPGNMVHVLNLIYQEVEQERLFRLLPTGGESGTISKLYVAEKPFIHAKTGSLRNNHSLSGYLIGDSGKIYVFSFMNSNYLVSNSELKLGMDKILRILKSNL